MDEIATHAQLERAVETWLDLVALAQDGRLSAEVRAELRTITHNLNAALADVGASARRLAAVGAQMEALAVKLKEGGS